MLKYYNAMVVFEEVPDEVSLAINISNCPCKCDGCHSRFLWLDIGTELTQKELGRLIDKNDGISCVCLMGGDIDHNYVLELASYVKKNYEKMKVCWYSGMDELDCDLKDFDYVKIGHYDKELGGLDKKTTNQRFYKIEKGEKIDITDRFWKG